MKTIKSVLCALIFLSISISISMPSLSSADSLDNWHLRNRLPQGNSLNAVIYGNGIFVTVGEYGTILTSLDGAAWMQSFSGTTDRLKAVTYGNGIFVVGGDGGAILTSSDGMTWTKRPSGTTLNLNGVAYGNGLFVAIGETILTSSDGVTWTESNPEYHYYIPWDLRGVAYGDGNFVAVGHDNILVSTDGMVWENRLIVDNFYYLAGVAYGNNTFVVVGSGQLACCWLIVSPDSVTWTKNWYSGASHVFYENDLFINIRGGVILISPDGVNWNKWVMETNDYYLPGVAYGNGTFVAVGENGTILQSDPVTDIEFISAPDTPNGPLNGFAGEIYSYSTGGSSSTFGGPVQYLFDWGDGTDSGWLPVDQVSASKLWGHMGDYPVTVMARSAVRTSGISWSESILVNISSIELQTPSGDSHFDPCSLNSLPTFTWKGREVSTNYEIQFSLDPYFISNSIPVKKKVPGSRTEYQMRSTDWKKILSISGQGGGTIYWRIIGMHSDRTTVSSEIRSFIIDLPQAVGDPTISSTSQSSPPGLSWQNNCNTKFKVWFGGNSNFIRKTIFTFNDKTPNDNGGKFLKALTQGRWTAVRRLVGDETGSTVYWYVESWDGLGRYTRTETMNFVLGE